MTDHPAGPDGVRNGQPLPPVNIRSSSASNASRPKRALEAAPPVQTPSRQAPGPIPPPLSAAAW